MLTVNKTDLANLRQALQGMKRKAGKSLVRKAAGKAMLPVRKAAKSSAPYDATDDGKHIRTDVAMRGRWYGDTLILRVGVRGGAKKNDETPYYWRFQEFGTKRLPAKPFLAPALESNEQEVYDTLIQQLTEAIFK
jgi:HK97 gp10 family phage protein